MAKTLLRGGLLAVAILAFVNSMLAIANGQVLHAFEFLAIFWLSFCAWSYLFDKHLSQK